MRRVFRARGILPRNRWPGVVVLVGWWELRGERVSHIVGEPVVFYAVDVFSRHCVDCQLVFSGMALGGMAYGGCRGLENRVS